VVVIVSNRRALKTDHALLACEVALRLPASGAKTLFLHYYALVDACEVLSLSRARARSLSLSLSHTHVHLTYIASPI
jgi:hypothetical protein